MLFKLLRDEFVSDSFSMLCRYNDSMDLKRYHLSIDILILDCYLRLSIRSQPWANAILPDFSQLVSDLSGQPMSHGHQFLGLVRSISKHVALVTSSDFLNSLANMYALCDFRALGSQEI